MSLSGDPYPLHIPRFPLIILNGNPEENGGINSYQIAQSIITMEGACNFNYGPKSVF